MARVLRCLRRRRQAEKAKKERIKPAWGGGMKQKLDAEARAEAIKAEAAKPFARYRCAFALRSPRSRVDAPRGHWSCFSRFYTRPLGLFAPKCSDALLRRISNKDTQQKQRGVAKRRHSNQRPGQPRLTREKSRGHP
jgi:hypothetical protein